MGPPIAFPKSSWKLVFFYQPKYIILENVLKRTVPIRYFFWAPKAHVETDRYKYLQIQTTFLW